MIIFLDETIRKGAQAAVPIMGFCGKRVLYGVLNVQTRTALLRQARQWKQGTL